MGLFDDIMRSEKFRIAAKRAMDRAIGSHANPAPLPRCERCGSEDDAQPMVTQVGGREPTAEMLCAGHRRAIMKLAATLAPYVPIRTTT